MKKKFSRERLSFGFTMIEILVVVSIFGLISSVALANIQSAREKATVAAGQQFNGTVERSLGAEIVGRWGFDEGSGDIALDSSGNNLDGDIVGATYTADGMSGSALVFDGNDYITGTDFPNPGENGRVTIIAWLRPTNVASANTIFEAGGTSCTAVQVGITGGKTFSASSQSAHMIAITDDEGNPVTISEQRVVENNLWQNTAFVFDGDVMRTYINGAEKNVVSNAGTSDCDDPAWVAGAASETSSFGYGYSGTIDSLQIFNSALTASEIQKIYAMSRDKYELAIQK